MESFAVYSSMQEYPARKVISGEPPREKEPSHQYSPRTTPSLPASPRESPKTPTDYKKRKRGRPPLEKDSRLCTNCGTAETPEWRKGPLGPHTLCNACGLQWMKAQKRENDVRTKFDAETRKRGSVLRVLNSHGSISTPPREQVEPNTRESHNGLIDMGDSGGVEISCRYSPERETLPSEVSPTISPMQQIQTPISIDTLNTLRAMQTLSALSQMNQINHFNTLNLLSMNTSNNNNASDLPVPSHYAHGHTVINHYNTNLNTFNSAYNLSPEIATPMARFPPLNPQQIFLPMSYNNVIPPSTSQANSHGSYIPQVPVKDYTSVNLHTLPSPLSAPHYPHYPQVHTHSSSHTHHFSHTSSLLHPNPHNLIPNPTANTAYQQHHTPGHEDHHHYNHDTDENSITGGGQM